MPRVVGARFFAAATVAIPAFFVGLFWSAHYGPSTTEADLAIGMGCATVAAAAGIVGLRMLIRRLPRFASAIEVAACLSGIAMLVLLVLAVS